MNTIGHEKVISFLKKSFEKNKISQAYLFSGPKHLGKFKIALDFAKKITGGGDNKINSDILIISSEDKKNIEIEEIRNLEHEFGLFPYFGKYKVAIIDDAEKLNISAQNALLKTLEEPRKNCVLILVCHNEERIIPTIRSRCLIKRFNLIKDDEIKNIFQKEKYQEDLIFWSLGRPGLALRLKNDINFFEKIKNIEKNLANLANSSLSERFIFSEKISKDRNFLIEELELWLVILRNNILKKKSLGMSSQKLLKLIEEIEKSLKKIKETNSNPRVVLEKLFLNF